jgi:hypothetical protein
MGAEVEEFDDGSLSFRTDAVARRTDRLAWRSSNRDGLRRRVPDRKRVKRKSTARNAWESRFPNSFRCLNRSPNDEQTNRHHRFYGLRQKAKSPERWLDGTDLLMVDP